MSYEYNFEVHTGDELYAGTDSNIFVQLVGERGTTNEMRLNGYIKGNAFERNQTDKFTVPFNNDVGDVYKIILRSDCRYAGSDWLLDYIYVRGANAAKKGTWRGFTQFQYAKWVQDTKAKTLVVTRGWNVDVRTEGRQYVEERGRTYHFRNTSDEDRVETVHIHQEWSVEVTLDITHMTSISTKASVKGEYKWIEAAFEFGVEVQLEKKSGYKKGQKLEIDRDVPVDVPAHTKDLELVEVWSVATLPVTIDMGDTDIPGNGQQDERMLVGLLDPVTNTWVFRTDAFRPAEADAKVLEPVE